MPPQTLITSLIDQGPFAIIALALGWWIYKMTKFHVAERKESRSEHKVEREEWRKENAEERMESHERAGKLSDSLVELSERYAAVTTRNSDALDALKDVLRAGG